MSERIQPRDCATCESATCVCDRTAASKKSGRIAHARSRSGAAMIVNNRQKRSAGVREEVTERIV
jgi:hypothetical protein